MATAMRDLDFSSIEYDSVNAGRNVFIRSPLEITREQAEQLQEAIRHMPQPQFVWHHENHEAVIEETERLYEARKQARERAEQLLVSCLSPSQRQQYEENSTFTVTGQSGEHYTIHSFSAYNVTSPTWSFCAGPQDVPICDQMLAQKLMLETEEVQFLRIANKHPRPLDYLPYDATWIERTLDNYRSTMGARPHPIPCFNTEIERTAFFDEQTPLWKRLLTFIDDTIFDLTGYSPISAFYCGL